MNGLNNVLLVIINDLYERNANSYPKTTQTY